MKCKKWVHYKDKDLNNGFQDLRQCRFKSNESGGQKKSYFVHGQVIYDKALKLVHDGVPGKNVVRVLWVQISAQGFPYQLAEEQGNSHLMTNLPVMGFEMLRDLAFCVFLLLADPLLILDQNLRRSFRWITHYQIADDNATTDDLYTVQELIRSCRG